MASHFRKAASALCAALALATCSKRVQVYDGPALTLGKRFTMVPGRHYWSFPAQPGERYELDVAWPDGALQVETGSARRDGHDSDDDDDEDVQRIPVPATGAHRWKAEWTIGPKANTGFFSVTLAGVGGDPIELTLDRR